MIAGFSDGAGRRPAYMACFSIYIVANIGLALQHNYVALMILRALQSAGSSGTVALAIGCVGDVVTSSERGMYVAWSSLPNVLGPSLAPILGGVLSQYLGWRSIFWFLTIFAAVYAIPLLLFFPETCRKVVGDGSVPPPKINQSITGHLREKSRQRTNTPIDPVQLAYVRENYRLSVPNPLGTLRILADRESALILFTVGFGLMNFYAINVGIPSQYSRLYHFSDLELGFVFLPMSVGTLVSAFSTGKLVDWNYRRHARALNFPVTRNRQQDLSGFPIETARLQIALPLQVLGGFVVIAYGWALEAEANLAVPLVLVFFLGWTLNATNQCMSILMVDTWPGQPATATAANNLVRCSLGAAASAIVIPMLGKIGNGWTYTFFALVFLAYTPANLVLMRYGPRWRRARKEREDKAKAEKKRVKDERSGGGVAEAEVKTEGAGMAGDEDRIEENHAVEALEEQAGGAGGKEIATDVITTEKS
ncbi:MFS general substrate transporter [Mytilinidion resinicola]|uniref:MFS general substrate transporter n=1 Tax=Mytilinidion resinicola TaxID=574789 RepID=A0A6A6Z7L6_9PEZI|nr:MFS general substrate transporter [Mytilinidion resinicola]KAF2816673.1 MFS general substrate transporter [Mytilinidion resinicola]